MVPTRQRDRELYVFGSTIRGDAHGRASYVDVLIVLDDDADRIATADLLRDIALDVMIEYGPAVEHHILSETTFERHQREQNPFSAPSSLRGACMPDDTDTDPTVEGELQQARQALDDATKARDADLSDAAVIDRLYYAAFHALQAVLYDRGFDLTSHGGVLSLFGSRNYFRLNPLCKDSRFFSQLSELRQQADYGYDELNEDVDALHSRTQQFVSKMEALRTSPT